MWRSDCRCWIEERTSSGNVISWRTHRRHYRQWRYCRNGMRNVGRKFGWKGILYVLIEGDGFEFWKLSLTENFLFMSHYVMTLKLKGVSVYGKVTISTYIINSMQYWVLNLMLVFIVSLFPSNHSGYYFRP